MTIALLVAYLLVVLGIGFYASRKQSAYDYLISSRAFGPIPIGFSIAAGFLDAFVLLTFTAYVYTYGWPALSLFIGTGIGLILFAAFAPRLRDEAGKHNYFGMSDYFEHHYGRSSAILVSVINVVFYVSLLLIQIIFGSTLVSQITGFPYAVCVAMTGLTLLAYVGMGGFRAVVMTDMFQWSLIAVLLVLAGCLISNGAVLKVMTHSDWSGSAGDAVGFLLIGCMASFAAPELWQRCFAARDGRSARSGTLLAALCFPVSGIVLAVVGFSAAATYPGIDPQNALIRVFGESFSGGLQGTGLILLLAAIMSTADTCLFVIAPTITLNILGAKIGEPRKKPTFLVLTLAVAVACICALMTQNILQVAMALASLSLGIFPVLIVGIKKQLSATIVNIALTSGFLIVVVALAAGNLGPTTSVLSLPVSFVVVGVWLVVQKFRDRHRSAGNRCKAT